MPPTIQFSMYLKSNMKFALINLTLLFSLTNAYMRDAGPSVIPSKGEIWPQPQTQTKSDDYFIVRPTLFNIQSNTNCLFLKAAFLRYQNIFSLHYRVVEHNIRRTNDSYHNRQWLKEGNLLGYLNNLNVTLDSACSDTDYPTQGVDESYNLTINSDPALLTANTQWGILRGLESFSQSIYIGSDLVSLRTNKTTIYDYPRFQHRGLLVDTSRHYIPINYLLANLDAMAYNKLNVFHWHIVDDESFPYVSSKYPELINGAYTAAQIYPQWEITTVIEYAKDRGIRVIPEFDTPGHTRSWGVSHPELLTTCYHDSGVPNGKLGPMDPSKNSTYAFLRELFKEVTQTFKDEFIHIGGDEVDFECWESNRDLTEFMIRYNITTYNELESYFIQRVINDVDNLNTRSIVWEEVFSNGVILPLDTVVQIWKINDGDSVLQEVTASGHQALLSSCWYLDYLQFGGDWKKFYDCEPYQSFSDNDSRKKLIIGGEVTMWAEVVNMYNFLPRVWPRASAAAERLWSSESVKYMNETERRIEEHTCRLNTRGIRAQPPNGAGFCY